MFERNLKYLNDNRILYRRDPVDDIPTKQYNWGWYYEHGTFECYALFRSKAKITTYKSLKWHLIVLGFLNQEMTHLQFDTLARVIANKKNGYITFNCPTDIIDKIINETMVYALNFDLQTPNFNDVKVVSVHQILDMNNNQKLKTAKRMGYKFSFETNND